MCFICGRSFCAIWMHSSDEQKKYRAAIDLYKEAIALRNEIRDQEEECEDDE